MKLMLRINLSSPPNGIIQKGIWFMGASLGNLIAGLAAGQIGTLPMQELFTIVASVSVIAGVIYLLISPLERHVKVNVKAKELVID